MVTSDGTPILVPQERIQEAYAAGHQLESPEAVEQRAISRERGTIGQQAITAVEGGARGLTLGASDVVAAGVLGQEYGQAALERRQVNPLTSVGSELVGGFVGAKGAGLLKASPAALAARAGSGAGRLAEAGAAALGYRGTTAAGRMAARALSMGAAGATEGALWGVGSAASQAALEGSDLTAEKILAGAGEGAELGGLFGAGLGAGERFMAGLARRAAEGIGLEGGLTGLGARLRDRAALRAGGFTRSDVRKLGRSAEAVERRVAELSSDLRTYKFRGNLEETAARKGERLWEHAGRPEDLAADLATARQETGSALGKLRDKIDAAIPSGPAQFVSGPGLRNAQFLRTGMREESMVYARSAYAGATREAAEEIATRGIDPVRIELFPDEAGGFRITLGDGRHRLLAAEEAGARHIRANIQRWTPDGDTIDLGDHVVSIGPEKTGPDIRGYLTRVDEEVLRPMRESLSPTIQRRARRIEEELRPLAEAQAAAEAGGEAVTFKQLTQFRTQLRDVFQPKTPVGGGIPAPVPEGAAELERAERLLSRTIDESAEAALKTMGDSPAEYLELKRQYGAFSDLESVAKRAAADEVGKALSSPWEQMLGFGSGLGALASGNVGVLAAGIGSAAASRIIREHGDRALVNLLDRVSGIDETVKATAKTLAGKEKPIRAYAAIPVSVGKAVEQYEKTRDAVREMQSNPQETAGQLARLVAPYSIEYPAVANAVQARAQQQLQTVAAALPEPYSRAIASLTPTEEESGVGIHDINIALRRIRAATSPAAVINDLRSGNLDLEAIKTLRDVSPGIYGELRSQVVRELADRGETVPMNERMFLGLAFDVVSDYSLRPGVMSAIQASQAPPPAPGPAPSSPSPNQKPTLGSMSDRLEGM